MTQLKCRYWLVYKFEGGSDWPSVYFIHQCFFHQHFLLYGITVKLDYSLMHYDFATGHEALCLATNVKMLKPSSTMKWMGNLLLQSSDLAGVIMYYSYQCAEYDTIQATLCTVW